MMRTFIVNIMLLFFALKVLKNSNVLLIWRIIVATNVLYLILYDSFNLYVPINSFALQLLWILALIVTIIGVLQFVLNFKQ